MGNDNDYQIEVDASQKYKVKADWLTFTVFRHMENSEDYLRKEPIQTMRSLIDFLVFLSEPLEHVPNGKPRRPYTKHYRLLDGGGGLYANEKTAYGSMEFTGQGCTRLHQKHIFDQIGAYAMRNGNPTRFDIAIDVLTDTTPSQFVAEGFSDRIKSVSHTISTTGETVYIGSPKSDIMCRVYRYNKPHPRHEKLRIELVGRREKAKDALNIWLQDGPMAAVAFLSKGFKFDSQIWHDIELDQWSIETTQEASRSDSKTLAWLLRQAKPALLKLALADSLSPAFWHEFFDGIPDIKVTYLKDKDDDQQKFPF